MRLLAVETSGRTGSVALAEGARVLCSEQFPHGLRNAAGILPLIDRLTKCVGWAPRDLDAVLLSLGPGSFTGLRIAVTLAKTLAHATGARLLGVPSTDVLVRNAPKEARHVIIVLDAKRGQVFTARFERVGDQWVEREPPHLDTLETVLARAPRPVHLLGEGIDYHRSSIPDSPDVIVTAPALWRAQAEELVAAAQDRLSRGLFDDPLSLTPIYIRLAEAEERRLALGGALSAARIHDN
jgi:tRNA threonylcarbamoyladenosine biosynthesis protein TsaB